MIHTRQNVVGIRVREARTSAKTPLTQAGLSQKLGRLGVSIDRAAVAKIETGIRGVLDYEVIALATALGVKASWLLNAED